LVPADQDLVERKLYTYAEVDRILGLAGGTARRWINGYERRGVDYDPVVRPEPVETDRVRWGEFIEVYYLSRFRDSGIPLQKLRATLAAVRERTESHYLFADDKVLYAEPDDLEVIFELQEAAGVSSFLVKRTGQIKFELFPDARKRLERITYEDGVARALRPRLDLDHVVVYADRFFGKPKIEDTGISPEAVARLVRSGTPIKTVSDLYGVEPSIINEAGFFSYGDRWKHAA
jgi:uncharacterized protein (DUF433 family)